MLFTSEFDHTYFMLDFYVFLALFGRFHMRYLQSLHHTHRQYLAIFTSSARHPPSSTPHRLVFLSHSAHKKHACMAAFTSPHPSSHPCSNIRQAHPPMLAWPCMATRSCHHSIPTLQRPCKHPSFHTHLHANPTSRHLPFLYARVSPSLTPPCAQVLFSGWERVAAKQAFHSPRASSEPPLGFGAAASVLGASL